MDMELKERFTHLWKKYFNNAELPITFYYTDEEGRAEPVEPGSTSRCMIGPLSKVRKGNSLCFDAGTVACFGGKRYLGFSQEIMPDFEYFLSCGVPGKLEGERYKKSPELVKELMKSYPEFRTPSRFIVFKRWDMLDESDNPEVVIFFAKPDVLSGIFTLSNFDEPDPDGVIAPMGSGCGTAVMFPYLEKDKERPRGVIGMFDISARPFVPGNMLTFAVPMKKFTRMIENMEESFLITDSWKKVQERIE